MAADKRAEQWEKNSAASEKKQGGAEPARSTEKEYTVSGGPSVPGSSSVPEEVEILPEKEKTLLDMDSANGEELPLAERQEKMDSATQKVIRDAETAKRVMEAGTPAQLLSGREGERTHSEIEALDRSIHNTASGRKCRQERFCVDPITDMFQTAGGKILHAGQYKVRDSGVPDDGQVGQRPR